MSNKQLAERLNKELDAMGAPANNLERIDVFAKLIKVPKFKAEALLQGLTIPDAELLQRLSEELEVSPDWLLGKTEQRKKD